MPWLGRASFIHHTRIDMAEKEQRNPSGPETTAESKAGQEVCPGEAGPADAETGAATPPETATDPAMLQAEVSTLREQLREQQLRNLAEIENLRKRNQREISNSTRYGAEKLLRDLLAVCDSLELGLKAVAGSDADVKSITDGLSLTHRQLLGVLEKHGVAVVDPLGELFNPEWHEAVAAVPNDQVKPNHVLEVMQKGYRLHDRLLRPARVVVVQAPAQ